MNLRAYWRFVLVTWQFLPLVLAYARDRRRFLLFGRPREVTPAQRRERAKSLLDSLLTLGPTFIKLGQLLSTRPDVLPPEYVHEFTKLQDRVPPANWDDAREVLEAELGPVDQRFEDFEIEAISGASLGQVYRGRVDGEPVAVKVRRPGVEALVEADLRVVRWTLPLVRRFVDDARSFSLESLADEFDRVIRQEMDYRREARMLTEIRGNFADQPDVRMPAVIDSHSTGRVLTMEYVPGTKISDVETIDEKGIDRSALAERIDRLYLQMIIEDGVFHADPHPGNLAVQDDGTLVVYDFGMSGYVDAAVQDQIVAFYTAVARRDIDALLDALVEMGTLSPEADRQLMSEVVELAITDASGEDIEHYRVQQLVRQFEETIYEFPFRLPSDLALVMRVATVVEGVCVTLDPDFDFVDVGADFLRERGYVAESAREYVTDRATEAREAAESLLAVPPKLESALDRVEREDLRVQADIEDSEGHLTTLARRLVYGMAFAAGILATTVLYAFADEVATLVALGFTLLVLVQLYRSLREPSGVQAYTTFTRHEMRSQEAEDEVVGYGTSQSADDDGDDGRRDAGDVAGIPVVEERGDRGDVDLASTTDESDETDRPPQGEER